MSTTAPTGLPTAALASPLLPPPAFLPPSPPPPPPPPETSQQSSQIITLNNMISGGCCCSVDARPARPCCAVNCYGFVRGFAGGCAA